MSLFNSDNGEFPTYRAAVDAIDGRIAEIGKLWNQNDDPVTMTGISIRKEKDGLWSLNIMGVVEPKDDSTLESEVIE